MKTILLVLSFLMIAFPSTSRADDTVYDRIIKSGKIRCGYYFYSPVFMKNNKTGAYEGVSHDIIQEVGHLLDLEIEFVEEVSIAGAIEGLKTKRYDVMCSGFYKRPNVMKDIDFIGPYAYVTVNAYVRPDDHRFDNDITIANDSNYTISSVDGTIPDIIARESFQKASRISLPDLSPYSDNLLNVTTKKADLTFVENSVANEFLRTNPKAIRKVEPPVRVFPVVFYINKKEQAALNMLNAAVEYLNNNGTTEKIIQKYERTEGDYLRILKPYEVKK